MRFGARRVLTDLDFEVERGQRLALLGLNGAGKTTLLRCLMGLLPFEGAVSIDGTDVATAGAQVRRLIGYVPQRPPLFQMRLGTLVEFVAALRGLPQDAIAARLESFGLPLSETEALTPAELSGGMLQKALLAMALAGDPPVLLLDEPTANLDPRARGEFLRALRQVGRETTVVLASHRLDEVETVADRVWILHRSGRAFAGSLGDLREQAGAESWLWVSTQAAHRDDALRELSALSGHASLIANGTHLAVQLPAAERLEVLKRLESAGIPVDDFWVVGPSLEEIVERFFVEEGP